MIRKHAWLLVACGLVACGGSIASGGDAGDSGPDVVMCEPLPGPAPVNGVCPANACQVCHLLDIDPTCATAYCAPASASPGQSASCDMSHCGPLVDPFACGSETCTGDSFCEIDSGAADGGGGSFAQCVPLPTACVQAPTCACVEGSINCASPTCSDDAGQITLRCGP